MRIFVYLYDKIYNYSLPDKVFGSFSFDPEDDNDKLINVEARNDKWVLYSTSDVKISHNNVTLTDVVLEIGKYYILERNNKIYLLYIKNNNMDGFLAYKYENELCLTLGNVSNASIQYNCSLFDNAILSFCFRDNKLIVTNGSKKGFYVNNNYTNEQQTVLSHGDELDLLGFKIIFLKQFIMFFNTENIKINDLKLQANLLRLPKLDTPEDLEINDQDLYKKEDYFFKSPRIRRNIEKKQIEFTTPPNDKLEQEMPAILTVGPMLTMGLYSGVTLLNTLIRIVSKQTTLANSWSSLLTSIIMLISMLVWPSVIKIYQKKMKKKKLDETIKKYMKYLDNKKAILQDEQNLQKEILRENLITVEDCLKIIENKSVNFWDKRIDQDDFLTLRIGRGNMPLLADLQYTREDFSVEDNEIKDKVEKIIDEYQKLINVPIGYSFCQNKISAIMGSYKKTSKFLNNLILQIVTFYSYEDVKIVFFTNDKNMGEWEYLKYTNHCFSNDKSFRFFSSDADSAKEILEYLNGELNIRKSKATHSNESFQKPYYIIITDDYEKIKRYEFTKNMTESDENFGFSLIILENKLGNLPSKCNNFINIGQNQSAVLINAYEKQEQLEFHDEIHYEVDMMDVAKKIANIPIEFEKGNIVLPNTLTFLEMERVGKVEQLNILNRWNSNDATKTLKTEIGIDEFGDLMYLDLHEKYQGPHGLIAGMTGSGKSEFIITYILSMAINYSPDYVSFVLIDYKGGGLAYAFENRQLGITLPHLSGIITNLDTAEMNRTLVSIESEIKRRQSCFNVAREKLGKSTMDIYKYQNYYKEGKVSEPISHLFIICDEFAELKKQQPEFMENLISVARIGRSLGVHLILATQKPSGIVNDQIWSNTRFRVCLKVQDENDSKEVLKRSDAAYLKNAGRFYLQVGFDEYFSLGQSAWSGAKYYPSTKILKQIDKSIGIINDNGLIIKSAEADNNRIGIAQGEQISEILNSIIETSKSTGKKAKKLWLENIPDVIFLGDLEKKYNVVHEPYNVKAILGEYDAPEIQQQGLVEYNFLEDGNTIIYGVNGIDREMLLNQIIYSSTKNHQTNEINYYIVDYGSEALGRWTKLPHVGGIVFSSEQEEFVNLIKLLKEELQIRKKLFVDYGGHYRNYIKQKAGMPLKVVILNNYESIIESNYSFTEELAEMIRDSYRYGIIYILTATSSSSIQSKILQNISNKYVLRLNNLSDCLLMFDQKSTVIPKDGPGRGLLDNGRIHEFQTASIVPEDMLTNFIINYINDQIRKNEIKAKQIPVLPDVVTYEDIKQHMKGINNIPIGINKQTLEVETIDYLENIGNIVSSYKLENTKNFTISLLSILKEINNLNLFIFDTTDILNLDKALYPNYYRDNFEQVINHLNKSLDELIEKNVEATGVILIYGINKLLTKISNSLILEELFSKLKKYEKIGLIIMDDVSKLKNRVYESWFNNNFDLNHGLWIGRGVYEQSLLRLSFTARQVNDDIKNDMGYIIRDGSPALCKIINFTDDTEEDFYEQ